MTDPGNLPLYYLDGPLATRSYTDPNTPTGHRWRDGRGACYEVTTTPESWHRMVACESLDGFFVPNHRRMRSYVCDQGRPSGHRLPT